MTKNGFVASRQQSILGPARPIDPLEAPPPPPSSSPPEAPQRRRPGRPTNEELAARAAMAAARADAAAIASKPGPQFALAMDVPMHRREILHREEILTWLKRLTAVGMFLHISNDPRVDLDSFAGTIRKMALKELKMKVTTKANMKHSGRVGLGVWRVT